MSNGKRSQENAPIENVAAKAGSGKQHDKHGKKKEGKQHDKHGQKASADK